MTMNHGWVFSDEELGSHELTLSALHTTNISWVKIISCVWVAIILLRGAFPKSIVGNYIKRTLLYKQLNGSRHVKR